MTVHSHSFEQLARAVVVAVDENFDISEPQTSIKRIKRATEAAVDAVPSHAMERELRFALREVQLDPYKLTESREVLLRELKRCAKEDSRYSLLLKLAADASTKVAHLAFLVWNAYPRDRHIHNILLPAPHFYAATRTSGESRVREVLSAMKVVGAQLYEPYLRCLINLTLARKNDYRLATGTLGVLVDRATSLFSEYPGLVDSAAGLLRNADAHYHWEYDDQADTIIFWDSNRPYETWTAGALLQHVQAMWWMSGKTFLAVRDLLMIRALEPVFTGDVLLDFSSALLSRDTTSLEHLTSVFEDRVAVALGPACTHLLGLAQQRVESGALQVQI